MAQYRRHVMTKVSGVHHVAIGVKDLKRIMAFYQGVIGYLQAAFDCADVNGMAAELTAAGLDLLCSPKVMVDGIADHPGEFVYARDPDGIPVEFLYIPQ